MIKSYTSKLLMVFATIFFTHLSSQAQTLITSCNSEFMDIGGSSANYLDNENSDWLICPDDLSEYLELEFTHVDIETAVDSGIDSTGCRDLLYLYDGMDDQAPLLGSYCGEESGNGNESFIEGHTLRVGDKFKPTNSSGCFYIKFESDNIESRSGWYAQVNCCTPSLSDGVTDGIDLPLAINGGSHFNVDSDNNCIRKGSLDMFTDFEATGASCFTNGLTNPFQSFYAFKSDEDGGFIEILADVIDSVGNVEMLIYGPVTLDSASYTGGVIINCGSDNEDWSIFFNSGPNKTYILAVATELEGKTSFKTLPSSEGVSGVLPVVLESYDIHKKGNSAVISWNTSEEINNQGFEVYRSTDGKTFADIGWVDAKSKGNRSNSYSFEDTPNHRRTIYYYVKQYDRDGNSKNFDILKVDFNEHRNISSYPNPSNGLITIETGTKTNDEISTVLIYNQLGQIKYSAQIQNNGTIDVSHLESGMYTIQIFTNGKINNHQHIISN